ncbi:MAG: ethylbenzene dehydrogenase [Gammaproteobacteria bacterium]|jgi:DMSO reductase family type II enzyme molybdopterin subunit|nr:ethylbenzene dehydrogenase [Gammaproteobacteria bacterium]
MAAVIKEDKIYNGWEDIYRNKWEWDEVYWGSHCVDCYPGSCPMRVYVKDGIVWREEQAGSFDTIEENVPDFNPMGCQKGASWSQSLYGPDRLLYPLKRVGERGEGKWNRVSWDDALTDIADSLVDAIQEYGPHTITHEGTPEYATVHPTSKFFGTIGGAHLDLNGSINDFSIGLYQTFGKFSPVSSADDWFHSELILIWHMNPVFTRIPFYHFIAEARYNGAEVVNISPDINPSHTHADYQVPINGATDPAFGLAIVQVILEEKIADWEFIREQTDLAYLVRSDTGRYLRETEVTGSGREDQMYQWDPETGLMKADRGDCRLNGLEVALEGTFEVELGDGTEVEVRPVLEVLTDHLNENFTPEKQEPITGVHPDTIRLLARKVASKRTNIMLGYNACKFYHGDLIERAMCLVLAVSGNWGKQGTGIRCWASGMHEGQFIAQEKPAPGAQATEMVIASREAAFEAFKAIDPTATTEIAIRDSVRLQDPPLAEIPAFFWYDQCGYEERWNTREWGDESLPRSFNEYMKEALDKGWWDEPSKDPPQVLIECGGNMLRRTRGGKTALLDTLWPKLKKIVTIDFRMSQTALYADYVLPAAQHYEKIGFSIPTPHVLNLNLSDKAVKPAGEARNEWDIYLALVEKFVERAAARGLKEYETYTGDTRVIDELVDRFTMGGYYKDENGEFDEEKLIDEGVRDSVMCGTLPMGTSLDSVRDSGPVRFIDFGVTGMGSAQASPIEKDKTHVPFRNHTESGHPFPTYARRAQFFIDHDWFIEAGEQLPTHKPDPKAGGDYPLGMTSGHNRWSIHTMNQANSVILGTHRGEPNMMVNPDDAAERDVEDDDLVRVYNDVGEFKVRVKIAANVKPGQVVSYNGWAGSQYKDWSGANEMEPGMVKWIGFAGGYGHLNFFPTEWQPVPVSRWTRCEFEKIVDA